MGKPLENAPLKLHANPLVLPGQFTLPIITYCITETKMDQFYDCYVSPFRSNIFPDFFLKRPSFWHLPILFPGMLVNLLNLNNDVKISILSRFFFFVSLTC